MPEFVVPKEMLVGQAAKALEFHRTKNELMRSNIFINKLHANEGGFLVYC